MLADVTTDGYSRDTSIGVTRVSARVRRSVVCANCRRAAVHAQGRCVTCYRYWLRHGGRYDRPLANLDGSRRTNAPAAEDEETLTFAEWCRDRGYDPERRVYLR